MKLDKKQVPQLIVLGLLVVGCVGYVSFTYMKPAAPVAGPAQEKNDEAQTAVVQVQAEAIPTGTFPNLTVPLPRRDPFAVQASGMQRVDAQMRPTATVSRPVMPRPEFGSVPPLTFGSTGPSAVPNVTIVPAVEPDPAFVLTGVIRGETNVAIIRVGASERHIVREGQIIDGRYRVLSVSEDGAVLACKDRRIHLKIGGVRNAS